MKSLLMASIRSVGSRRTRGEKTMRSIWTIVVAGLVFGWGATVVSWAAEETKLASEPASSSTRLQPGRAGAPSISFGDCHYEKTPAYDPHVTIECPPGEVVVAVYEMGARCCLLELR